MLGGTLIIGGTRGAIELIKTKQILIIVLFTLIGASVGTVLTSTLTPLWVYRGTVMGAIIGLFVFAILQGLADAASRQH